MDTGKKGSHPNVSITYRKRNTEREGMLEENLHD